MDRQLLVGAVTLIAIAVLASFSVYLCLFHHACGASWGGTHGPRESQLVISLWKPATRNVTAYDVYLADTPAEWSDGLMNYTFSCNLPDKCMNGMLFLFPNESQKCFWMKNTPEPLTQAWIDANGVVTAVYNATPEDTSTICNDGNAVLELYRYAQGSVSVGDFLPGGISALRSQAANLP